MRGLKVFWELLRDTAAEWTQDRVPRLGAALAYYTVFSLAPLLIVAIVIAGAVFGQADAQARIVAQIASLIGTEGAIVINRMIDAARLPREAGLVTTAVGATTLLIGALGVFAQLQDAFDTIWEVRPRPRPGLQGVLYFLWTRLASFLMVLVVGFLLLVSLIINTVINSLASTLEDRIANFALVAALVNVVLPFVVTIVLFGIMFKMLPDVDIAWRDVWPGAALSSLLFTLGKQVIGFYLGNSPVGTAYGAAGSLLIVLVWIYFSALVLYFGAEFTQVYVRRFGAQQAVPSHDAMPLTEAERTQQGLSREAAPPGGVAAAGAAQAAPAAAAPPADGLPPGYTGALLGFAAGLGAGVMVAIKTLRERSQPGTDCMPRAAVGRSNTRNGVRG